MSRRRAALLFAASVLVGGLLGAAVRGASFDRGGVGSLIPTGH